jgi:uncharacterized membrane protein SirB2
MYLVMGLRIFLKARKNQYRMSKFSLAMHLVLKILEQMTVSGRKSENLRILKIIPELTHQDPSVHTVQFLRGTCQIGSHLQHRP